MPQLGLDLGDCAPNHAKDGPDVQDKGYKKYNKIHPFIIGYGPKEVQQHYHNWCKSSRKRSKHIHTIKCGPPAKPT